MGLNTVSFAHDFLQRYIQPGDLCIDATAGRGRDTQLLCELVGPTGHVIALDVQQSAIDQTRARLTNVGLDSRCTILQDSHENMEQYAHTGTVRAIVFNFGYLPGGDHTVFTTAETSIPALKAGLRLLMPGGVMSLSLYYGGDTGYAERDALLRFLKTVDYRQYTVLASSFLNRPNDPPIPCYIWKELDDGLVHGFSGIAQETTI